MVQLVGLRESPDWPYQELSDEEPTTPTLQRIAAVGPEATTATRPRNVAFDIAPDGRRFMRLRTLRGTLALREPAKNHGADRMLSERE